ncbi:MAG: radical SAM protein [Spirochaetales bacterium]|nr:radical SAM protein [Spirochaetales bacterium]
MENGKNVLLLSTTFNEHMFGDKWKFYECMFAPVGLLYLATPLKEQGYKLLLVDLNVEKFEKKDFLNLLKQQNFILITCYNSTIHNVRKIISDIREVNEKAFVLCGGPYCNLSREYIEGSDVTCIGEAENHIVHILDSIVNKKSLKNIPGLIYKNNGKIVDTGGYMQVENLDASMPPLLELAKGKDYGYISSMKVNVAPISSSRGCPFSCYYCTYKGFKFRTRSIDKVINEIKEIVKAGYEYIFFCDDNFLVYKKRVHEIMDRIIKEKIKIRIFLASRVDNADYELYKKLRKAGVMLLLFGIESANQDVLDFYNKKATVEQARTAVRLAHKAGLLTLGYILIGSPVESEEHINNNKIFFDEVPLDFTTVGILRYEKGSKLWTDLYEKGEIGVDDFSIITSKKFSRYSYKEWLQFHESLLRHFYLNPGRIGRIIVKLFKLGQLSLLSRFFKENSISTFFSYIKTYGRGKVYDTDTDPLSI